MLARGKPEIDREVEKARLLIRQGGYFVNCDHHIPPDVSYDNITYFIDSVNAVCSQNS